SATEPAPARAPKPMVGGRAVALTAREREVAALVARGLSSREIAERLVISERTADTHVDHIRDKLGLHSRAQVAAWAMERGLAAAAAAALGSLLPWEPSEQAEAIPPGPDLSRASRTPTNTATTGHTRTPTNTPTEGPSPTPSWTPTVTPTPNTGRGHGSGGK